MDGTLKLWAVVAIVGALNYLSRLSFIALFARRQVPPLLARAFRYVPAAMLTALVLPMVVAAPAAPARATGTVGSRRKRSATSEVALTRNALFGT